MFTLKPISRDSVGGALAKAERYRLLNEPNEAVSICRDILEVDPASREARISMILALTDEIAHDQGAFSSAMEAIAGREGAQHLAHLEFGAGVARFDGAHDGRALGGGGVLSRPPRLH